MFNNKEAFIEAYRNQFALSLGKPFEDAGVFDRYSVLVRLLSNEITKVKTESNKRSNDENEKAVYYFSMEFLIGRLLNNYLINLGIQDIVCQGLAEMGQDPDKLFECEKDPGLGNGGLGRLAACFLDSMASLGMNGHGNGLRYHFGLFQQKIIDGRQIEIPDTWAANSYPWERRKPESSVVVKFGGTVEWHHIGGTWVYEHVTDDVVRAVPYDVPVVGYDNETVNNLRLWRAEPVDEHFDLEAFTRGEYSHAMRHRNNCDAITTILYPNDSTEAGRTLRLKQEYLLVAAGLGSILRDYKKRYGAEWNKLPERISVHINDTHPAMCVPELMRVLIDEEGLKWENAWEITTKTISYTNHTILPEAMEKWSIDLFRGILPRIYMIIEEIDRRYQENFDRTSDKWIERLKATSILWDGQVRMANLSVIGSYSVNGVAALHTDILKDTVLKDFYALTPDKFNNKTNGVSHRRFLIEANPKLANLITEAIGDSWIYNPMKLEGLLDFTKDKEFLDKLMDVKQENKVKLANYIEKTQGIRINPNSVFDIQVKRIHAYKRQLLNIFKVMALYNDLKANPTKQIVPHTFMFAGKAAQSYTFAKDVIRLINAVAKVVNNDIKIGNKIKVVFAENFNVSLAQKIYPATDISEQISTAGFEASGTGNMKFMFNGAITLGTLDGANVEIRDIAGDENVCIFGLSDEEVVDLRLSSTYFAVGECQSNPTLKQITNQLIDGFFGASNEFRGIYDTIFHSNDEYFVLRDFDEYMKAWYSLSNLYKDKYAWAEKSLINIAKAGYFTSDRTIAQYADEIWNVGYDTPKK